MSDRFVRGDRVRVLPVRDLLRLESEAGMVIGRATIPGYYKVRLDLAAEYLGTPIPMLLAVIVEDEANLEPLYGEQATSATAPVPA